MTAADINHLSRESRRRCEPLDAAIAVFTRFGHRKSSMDDVARAANASRQGLYLYFTNKEDLFRAAVLHALDCILNAPHTALANLHSPIKQKLIQALDGRLGRHVGSPVRTPRI